MSSPNSKNQQSNEQISFIEPTAAKPQDTKSYNKLVQNLINDKISFLNIVHNGYHKEAMTIKEIFDSNIYNSVKVITYVASPSFMFKTLKGFCEIEFIIGMEDAEYKENISTRINKLLSPVERIKFYDSLDNETKEKIELMS